LDRGNILEGDFEAHSWGKGGENWSRKGVTVDLGYKKTSKGRNSSAERTVEGGRDKKKRERKSMRTEREGKCRNFRVWGLEVKKTLTKALSFLPKGTGGKGKRPTPQAVFRGTKDESMEKV